MFMPSKSVAELLVEVSKESERYKMIAERLDAEVLDLEERVERLETENAALREQLQ